MMKSCYFLDKKYKCIPSFIKSNETIEFYYPSKVVIPQHVSTYIGTFQLWKYVKTVGYCFTNKLSYSKHNFLTFIR